ncbi:tRNA 2'-phosphotransferase [Seminavis robusta]|uniref:2'-phosphotransferase n=1 Tax=Seminavis robusta TaxID=568900 RepID=A0A9N8EEH8_9STRA|nr:tRNA 2'-phosphotransferase [Seminavis robusta]|eukprot:Sro1035_g233910.1 tRNA 2'-phosphotransferase (1241) ;mRNA; f:16797-20519
MATTAAANTTTRTTTTTSTTTNDDTASSVITVAGDDSGAVLPELVPLGTLLDAPDSYAAVDNSGSTGGVRLQNARAFVNNLGVGQVSLWNSVCMPPRPRQEIQWRSTGGTSPHTVFEPQCHVPPNANCFVFMTDGEIYSTAQLARHATVTAHLPSLLVLFRSSSERAMERVSSYNVSVVMAHYTAAQTAAVVVVNQREATHARLVAVKGDWVGALPSPPDVNDSLLLRSCPFVPVQQLRTLPSRVYPRLVGGTLPLSGNRTLHLDALLNLADGSEVLQQLSEEEMEDIARAFFTRGNLPAWRARLNQWLVRINQDAMTQLHPQAQTQQSTSGVHALLRRLHLAETPQERQELSVQVQAAVQEGAQLAQEAAAEASRAARLPRAIINAALESLTVLERSGMSATSLARLSNRAARANTINRDNVGALATLNTEGAPQEEDLVLYETGPVALCLRAMEQADHNTSDSALDQGLVVGQFQENAVFEPTLVALGMADQIETMDASPLTRQRMSVCLPMVSLQNQENQRVVYERLCLVFMNELAMPHVWLIALSSILRTIETEAWANPQTTATGRVLFWFAQEIMRHVTLPAGARLSPNRQQPINAAFASILQDEILTVHSSVAEASVILRLLHRFGAPAAFSQDDLRRSMMARIAVAVPQMHRLWLQANANHPWGDQGPSSISALLRSIYHTRIDSQGAHVPVSGSGHLAERLNLLLGPAALCAVSMFARSVGASVSDFVSPGLTLVVVATLDHVTSPHVSSTEAVRRAQNGHAAAIAEMTPATVGVITEDEALDQLRRRLAWARTPVRPLSPFTTPFGPSVFWFYAPDGTVLNMTEGFRAIEGDVEQEFRLTEHVRARRGTLMARYYGTDQSGAFAARTTTLPYYREMADEYLATSPDIDLSHQEQATAFINRVVQRIVGRTGVSAGNRHAESIEWTVAILLPSMLSSVSALAPGVDARLEPRPLSLQRRVELELGGRSPSALGDPPAPVWVPHDDPDMMDTLVRVQQEQERARVNAMRRRIGNPTASADTVPEVSQGLSERNLPRFSRALTWYLRVGSEDTIRPDGYVPVQTVLQALSENFSGATVDQVLQLVGTDVKARYSVMEENGVLMIRANQGHTITTVDPERLMTLIESSDDVPVCVHGTYEDAFQNILRTGGLNRMGRQAIQMAVGLPGDPEVRSGIRASVDVVIYIDVDRAVRQGLRFYRSANNVICCPGPIPVSCFIKAVRLRDGSLIPNLGDQ